MVEFADAWFNPAIQAFCGLWPDSSFWAYDFNVRGLLATVIICFICGAMGSLVVGNRMAFFSDALAHCAFAGVGLGLMICLLTETGEESYRERITLVMVGFGVSIGLLIAFVRDQTRLASDTVIGVFYAASIGIGAIFTRFVTSIKGARTFNIEAFIFGNPTTAKNWDLMLLIALGAMTAVFLVTMYNWIVLASASSSLALSRQIPVRLSKYLLIVLLALMVNLGQQITGTLLLNGLLIVPAATAANLANNLRQMFWYSITIALFVGIAGYELSWQISSRFHPIGISGTIVVLSAILFAGSMLLGRWVRRA